MYWPPVHNSCSVRPTCVFFFQISMLIAGFKMLHANYLFSFMKLLLCTKRTLRGGRAFRRNFSLFFSWLLLLSTTNIFFVLFLDLYYTFYRQTTVSNICYTRKRGQYVLWPHMTIWLCFVTNVPARLPIIANVRYVKGQYTPT